MITIKSGSGFTVLVAFKADDNTPATGLTPAITVYRASNNSKVEDAETMAEIGLGLYKYTVDTVVTNEAYAIYADGGATLDTYRYQYGAFYANAGNEDVISDNVDSILEDTSTTLPAAIATAGQGNGNKEVKFLVRDVAGVSAGGGCAVTIYADTGTTTQSTGTLYTDELGIVNVMLNAGTYYARAVKSGKTFPNPITITVNA